MSIHPLAAVSREARIGSDVTIGPFCVVEPSATLGDGCILENHVVVKSGTTLGANNHVMEGAVLGGFPQHVHMPEKPGGLVIGSGNTIRENVTIHRALKSDQMTVIGDCNLLMVNVHVAHDCHLGNHTILTNNTMLAGHVAVGDRAYISGAAAVHQFCRIGTLAMVGGQAHLTKDVPPYVTIDGLSSLVVGLNSIGLRRAGYDAASIARLKAAYRVIYRRGLSWSEVLRRLETQFHDAPADAFHAFLATTSRGITPARRLPPGAAIKINEQTVEAAEVRAKAG